MEPSKIKRQGGNASKSTGKRRTAGGGKLNATNPPVRGVTAEDGTSLARFERAALSLFVAASVDSVTTKQIAAQAGLSEGLLYRYAPSKQSLAENMFFAQHNRLGTLVRSAATGRRALSD